MKNSTLPHPKTRQDSKANTRALILHAAEDLFARRGFADTRAEDIAQSAGVAVGTIYMHFGDKNGLLREFLLQTADELNQRVQQVYQNSPADPFDLARAHVEAHVRYVEEHKQIARFVLSMMLGGHPAAQPMLDRAADQVEAHIRAGQQHNVYRSDINPRLVARCEVQMNLGLLSWWAEDPSRASREEIIDTLAKFRYSGIHSQTGEK